MPAVANEALIRRWIDAKNTELGDRAEFWQQLDLLPPTSEILPVLRQQTGEPEAANA